MCDNDDGNYDDDDDDECPMAMSMVHICGWWVLCIGTL
jgi:hypothetical protein